MEFPCRAFLCACGGRYAPPPHAWGIQRAAHAAGRLRRFIPTCVGNTPAQLHAVQGRPVHPHMRGEYGRTSWCRTAQRGSSPHAWGIHGGKRHPVAGGRFIPTCVGNTCCTPASRMTRAVHPHMRGEYVEVQPPYNDTVGSSPHAWGIPAAADAGGSEIRFIPTCVGNTQRDEIIGDRGAVHPHMRGEYGTPPAGPCPCTGSSPHAWGIHSQKH